MQSCTHNYSPLSFSHIASPSLYNINNRQRPLLTSACYEIYTSEDIKKPYLQDAGKAIIQHNK